MVAPYCKASVIPPDALHDIPSSIWPRLSCRAYAAWRCDVCAVSKPPQSLCS